MKKLILLYLLFLLSQQNLLFAQNNINLEVEFHPSFSDNSIFTINQNSENITLKIQKLKYNSDSISSELIEKVTLKKSNLINKLFRSNLSEQKSILVPSDIVVNDGIGLHFQFTKNKKTNKFKFESVNDTRRSEVMKLIFEIMMSHFKNEKTLKYVEKISSSFRFGLQSRQLNFHHIEYRIYGVIYWEDEDYKSVKKFLKRLPKKKSVILDLRSFIGNHHLIDELEELMSKRKGKNIYLLVNDYWKKEIDDYSIDSTKVFTNKDYLIKKIKYLP